jgi:hypothetical protein
LGLCLILSGARTVGKSNLISVFHNEASLLFLPPPTAAFVIAAVLLLAIPYFSAFIPSKTTHSSCHDKVKRHPCYGGWYGRIRL